MAINPCPAGRCGEQGCVCEAAFEPHVHLWLHTEYHTRYSAPAWQLRAQCTVGTLRRGRQPGTVRAPWGDEQ